MDLELSGKRALITGGSKGIGLATAKRMAQEGAHVVIVGRRRDALNEALDAIKGTAVGSAYAVSADVSTVDGCARAVEEAIAHMGGIDILVNNAGAGAAGPALNHSDETWTGDLELKLFGALRLARLAVPHMKSAGGGRIVNVTAIQGKQPGPNSGPSSVSRAAGIALTKVLSKELAPDKILVNTVCIGLIESEQIGRGARARFPDLPLDQAFARMGESVPLGRIGRSEEAGDVITFLCSARASYVTGVAINLDGGASAVV
jgi:NAD(P)-dependent dehydrogenase (short-subunit alcohol dehydrogenase family)